MVSLQRIGRKNLPIPQPVLAVGLYHFSVAAHFHHFRLLWRTIGTNSPRPRILQRIFHGSRADCLPNFSNRTPHERTIDTLFGQYDDGIFARGVYIIACFVDGLAYWLGGTLVLCGVFFGGGLDYYFDT